MYVCSSDAVDAPARAPPHLVIAIIYNLYTRYK